MPPPTKSVLVPQPDPAALIAEAIGEMAEEEIECRDHHVWPKRWTSIWVIVGEFGGCWEQQMTCSRCKYSKARYVHPNTGHLLPLAGRQTYGGSKYTKHQGIGRSLQSADGRGQLRLASITATGARPSVDGKGK